MFFKTSAGPMKIYPLVFFTVNEESLNKNSFKRFRI